MEPRQATWLELFFDLIFVVALGKVTHFLTHVHDSHLDEGIWRKFVLVFIPLWWIWVGHTVYSNRFDSDSRPHRVITLLLMFLLVMLSVVVSNDIAENLTLLVVIYSMARFMIIGLYFSAAHQYPDKAGYARKIAIFFSIGNLISLSSILFDFEIALFVFYSGIIFDIASPVLFRKFLLSLPVDREHLVERVGLLAIILLGESMISMANSLTNVTWDMQTIISAAVGFSFVCMIWWIYFDSFIFLIKSKFDINGTTILYSQLLTYMSLAILANMIGHTILNDLNITEFRILAMTGMIIFYIGKQTAYIANVPEYRYYNIRNTITVLSISAMSLLLPVPQMILRGMSLSLMVYIGMNYQAQIKFYGSVQM
ncbi:MAG: low temperature requirement protein A [Gammaproteobacteria bacterium]|nr:low temperature requirement protein A [Gammaproteobacteria bacterium]